MKRGDVNRHGLSRYIPAQTAREIRRKCGFGCVKCGCAVYTYEHVDPAFEDAHTHDAERMVLLCGGCHDLVTRGLLAKETIKQAALSPAALTKGYSFGPFDLGSTFPIVKLGELTARDTHVILRVENQDLLKVLPPESDGGPFRISAIFHDSNDNPIMEIEDNAWKTFSQTWDAEIISSRIFIREKFYKRTLILRSEPPHTLHIEQLHMAYRGYDIRCKNSSIQIRTPSGDVLTTSCQSIMGCDVALSVRNNGFIFGEGCTEIGSIDFTN